MCTAVHRLALLKWRASQLLPCQWCCAPSARWPHHTSHPHITLLSPRRAHTREVQEQFEALFQFKALLFLEELASILVTPFVLAYHLPSCAGAPRSLGPRISAASITRAACFCLHSLCWDCGTQCRRHRPCVRWLHGPTVYGDVDTL